jgi:decaprenyl-phosphate phosphoribosyltransferase
MKVWLTQLRIHHWVKNTFIFIPAFFAGAMNMEMLPNLLLGFLCFSLVASAIYIINDVLDINHDKLHVQKSRRPIAAGKISVKSGVIVSIVLALIGGVVGWFVGHVFLILLGSYFIVNLAYSSGLKNVFLLDLTLIAIGFLLRVFAGGAVAEVAISDWLVVMVFLLSFFIGLAKRRDDAVLYEREQIEVRKNVRHYNLRFIDTALAVMASVIVVAYIMYSISEEVVERAGSQYVYTTSLFVILGVMKYLQRSIAEDKAGSPIRVLFQDRFLQALVVLWVLTFYLLLYVF